MQTPMPPVMPDVPAPPAPAPAPQTARYTAIFDATWTRDTHPEDPPGDPHFSPLIGGTHRSTVSFWQPGGFATRGIRRMAEFGFTDPLDQEINMAIAAGEAEFLFIGPGVSDTPESVSFDFDVSQAFPLITLVTMVAPSPDWFVGVSGVPLFQNGDWRSDVVVDLFPYDAGTDSGVSFTSDNEEMFPRDPIMRLTGFPFLNNGQVPPLGTFTFRRLQ
jgi:hypothetical protein